MIYDLFFRTGQGVAHLNDLWKFSLDGIPPLPWQFIKNSTFGLYTGSAFSFKNSTLCAFGGHNTGKIK